MAPTVVAALGRRGWAIASIRFKPQWRPAPSAPSRVPKGEPTRQAVADLAALSERVEEPKLKAALRRFAARHGADAD